jgi:diguanylate cyclase (GGDEF)-like protein
MPTALIVEDTVVVGKMLRQRLERELGFTVDLAVTLAQAREMLDAESSEYLVAVLDLNLPDASGGDVVDLVMARGIPCIVFTGEVTTAIRDLVWSKGVVDYVQKGGQQSVEYVLDVVGRLQRNRYIKVMVVDDSRAYRRHTVRLLHAHEFEVIEAESGPRALDLLEEHPDVTLVVTDFNMPSMDGCQLVREIRRKHHRNQLAIIGVSSANDKHLSARFIKQGANDFIHKPFTAEEFYCRVGQNLGIIEHIAALERASRTDHLTGLCNRRHFFDTGTQWLQRAHREKTPLVAAMVDIDNFKKINDTLGHEAGDRVLVQLARLLQEKIQEPNLVARLGGEEFGIILHPAGERAAFHRLEHLRGCIEQTAFAGEDGAIPVTVSIGAEEAVDDSLDNLLRRADHHLYLAKRDGRNCVRMAGVS